MNFNKYTSSVPYPNKQDFTTYYHYKGGKCISESKTNGPVANGAVVEKVVDEDAYKVAREAYHKGQAEVKALFLGDLAEELCITNHPKKDKFLYLCWQEGHSGGWEEVCDVAYTWIDVL